MFYIEFDNHEWSRIILSRVHKEIFWVGDIPIIIDNDLIHKVIGLRNEVCNLVRDINAKKVVETNMKTKFDGNNMKVDLIKDTGVRALRKIIGYEVNHSLRVKFVPIGILNATYVMPTENKNVTCVRLLECSYWIS